MSDEKTIIDLIILGVACGGALFYLTATIIEQARQNNEFQQRNHRR